MERKFAGVDSLATSGPRIFLASFLAIILAETADTEIYHKLRDRSWAVRVLSSNVVSVPLDSITFNVIAFAGIFALSAAPDFAWHLDSAERLLWIPALVLLRELAYAFCQSASRSPRATCLKTSGMPVSNAQRRPS